MINMADRRNRDLRERANELYMQLSEQFTDSQLLSVKEYVCETITPTDLEQHCRSFSDICRQLTRQGKIDALNHGYLLELLKKVHRKDLRTMVEKYHKEQNENSELSIPLTCLYNQEKTLPIEERLDEFLNVLERCLGKGPDTIPQQLFYTNVAAGIARPEIDLTLHLGQGQGMGCSVIVPKGAVRENKIIYCHYVNGLRPCLLSSGESLVCYAIPIFLGPPGEKFDPEHKVVLDIASNIVDHYQTNAIKFFVRQEDEPVWREGGEHLCIIRNDGRATIILEHFSEFTIGADPSTARSLPPLRARLETRVIRITETERRLVICIMFDSPFTIKKANEKIGKRGNDLSGQNIEFQPLFQCMIQARGDRWRTKDPIADVTKEEFSTLVFNPIVREVEMILQESHVSDHADTMCDISFTQKSKCQTFVVTEATLKLETVKKASRSSLHAELTGTADKLNTNAGVTTGNRVLTEVRKQQIEIKKSIESLQKVASTLSKQIQQAGDLQATSEACDDHGFQSELARHQAYLRVLCKTELTDRRPAQASSGQLWLTPKQIMAGS